MMNLFKPTSATIRGKLADLDRAIAVQHQIVADAAITAAIDDTPEAAAAQHEIYRLQQKHDVLAVALAQALDHERDADRGKAERVALATARAGDQHLARIRRACAGIQDALAALTAHYTEARTGIASFVAVVGDPRDYPGLTVGDLKRAVDLEMFRASAEPGHLGDESPLIAMPPGVGAASRLPTLVEAISRTTKFWAGLHRSRLGLATEQPAAVAQEPPRASSTTTTIPDAPSAPYEAPERRTSVSFAEAREPR